MSNEQSAMSKKSGKLDRKHPCSTVFLDETGAISKDRFFGVGVLKVEEPSRLTRVVQKFRDQKHWYNEFKFTDLTNGSLPLYKELIDTCFEKANFQFFCFMADREVADPIERFGSQWAAYAKLAEQLIAAARKPSELMTVLADNYSTPDEILFEEDLRANFNRRFRRLALVSVCRLDSKSSDGLQMVDLFTSAIAHEFRASAGLASKTNAKADFSGYIRGKLGASTCLQGWRNDDHSVAIYEHGRWQSPV